MKKVRSCILSNKRAGMLEPKNTESFWALSQGCCCMLGYKSFLQGCMDLAKWGEEEKRKIAQVESS